MQNHFYFFSMQDQFVGDQQPWWNITESRM